MDEAGGFQQDHPHMQPVLEKLLALQDRDLRILLLKKEMAEEPTERAVRQKQLQTLEAKFEAARVRAREIEVERKALEVEVLAKQEQIAKYKGQQMQTRKNEEYSALSHEISAADAAISKLEDQELALMEEAENLLPQLAAAETEFQAGKQQIATQLAGLDKKLENLKASIADLEASRPSLLEGVEEDVLEIYTRLFQSKQGTAIVALESGVCTGCHVKVPAQTVVEARAGKSLVHCPQCGRLLFFP